MTKPPRLFLIFDLEGRCATSDQFPKPRSITVGFLGRRLTRFRRSLGLTTSCMSGSRLENQIRLFRNSELGSIASALIGFLIGNIWEMRPCAKSIRGQRDRSRSDLGWQSNERILIKKLLNMLSSSDEGQSGHCSCGVARWNAYRLTRRFPVPRAAVSLGGWSACLLVLSSGI